MRVYLYLVAFVTSAVLSTSSIASAAESEVVITAKIKAKLAANRGTAFFDTGSWDEAIKEFKTAYRLYQAKEFLFSIAQSYRKKGNCALALQYYRSFLAKRPSPERVEMVRKIINSLEGQCDLEAEALKRKKEASSVPPQGAELSKKQDTPPGAPRIGGSASGTKASIERSSSSSGLRPWAYAAWGVSAAAIGTGAALIAIHIPRARNGLLEPQVRSSRTPGIVVASAGGAFAVSGLIMFLMDSQGSKPTQASILPIPGGAAVSLSGSW